MTSLGIERERERGRLVDRNLRRKPKIPCLSLLRRRPPSAANAQVAQEAWPTGEIAFARAYGGGWGLSAVL